FAPGPVHSKMSVTPSPGSAGCCRGTDPFMIVDCHTHIWQSPDQLGQADLGETPRTGRGARQPRVSPAGRPIWRVVPPADPEYHWASSGTVDKSIVLGFKSRYLRAEIPNSVIAEY